MSRRIIVLHEELELIMKRLDCIEEAVKIRQKIPEHTFFDNKKFFQIMNLSKRTSQERRHENIIAFSQIGSKIYYTMANIVSMLNKHHKPAKSKSNAYTQGHRFY